MKTSKRKRSLGLLIGSLIVMTLVFLLPGCKEKLERVRLPQPAFDDATLVKMRQTRVSNMDSIIEHKQLAKVLNGSSSFSTVNPFYPAQPLSLNECQNNLNCAYAKSHVWMPVPVFPAQPIVYQWWEAREMTPDTANVCGVKFNSDHSGEYELKTFENINALQAEEGYVLTHYHACGTCSTLQDLAVYGELDLTKMGKVCSKRKTLAEKKSCMQEIGFTEACAESWAYNASRTGKSCALICIKEYGVLQILTGKENKPPVNDQGELNSCLQCDEMISGPGFQYSAGRTRRDSGIISEIDRPSDQVYFVPHRYFE